MKKSVKLSFKRLKFKTGQKVFDWVIPKEWNIKDAYIKHEKGKKFADDVFNLISTPPTSYNSSIFVVFDVLGSYS